MPTVLYFLLGFAALYVAGGILLFLEWRQAMRDMDDDS